MRLRPWVPLLLCVTFLTANAGGASSIRIGHSNRTRPSSGAKGVGETPRHNFTNIYNQQNQNVSVHGKNLELLQWRLIGPFRGGRAIAVTGVPQFPSRFYFGGVDGGVWESENAGRTWNPIFDKVPVGSIGAIAVAPSDPNIVYVGTGEADMRSNIATGNGMYRSDNAGKTWVQIGLKDTLAIGKILVDPADPHIVFAAALGHPYGPNEERGVFKSSDGGKSWSKTLYKNPDTGAIDLAFDPKDSKTVYATMWRTRRPPWNVYPPSNGVGSGLYKSTDSGETWSQITGKGFPSDPGRIGIAVSPVDSHIVFALVDASKGGLFKSTDAGETWSHVCSDERIWGRGWYFGGVTADPVDPNIVYICNTAMYKSTDGGKTFVPNKGAPGGDDYHTLWIDSTDPSHRILGVDQGVVVSLDSGNTWSSWFNQPTAQIYHIAADNQFPYWVYGAQQDSGAMSIPSRTFSTDGVNMTNFREITVGGESDMIAPDPLHPGIIFGSKVSVTDLITGETKSVDPTLVYPGKYRSTWTQPLVFSEANPKALYFSNQFVFKTLDGGEHWSKISPDLSQPTLTVPPNLDEETAQDTAEKGPRRGLVYSLAPSAKDAHLLWAGTDDGLVWKTVDDGGHWQNVTPPALTAWSKVGNIDAPAFNTNLAYISVDRHRLDDRSPYIYRTSDGGKTWKLITSGIPSGDFVNVVRADPTTQGLLYAGTEHGVFFSLNDGESWQTLQQNLPATSVRDLIVKNDDLVIATHGRGVYIMDNISPLRGMASALESSKPTLFDIPTAYLIHAPGFTGSPMPHDEPRGENPPDGAVVDYLLPQKEEKVLLTVSQYGKTVFTASSTDHVTHIDTSKLDIAPEWVKQPQPISTEPGLHQWVWNLQNSKGLFVPPGDYLITLTVDRATAIKTVHILGDPRINLGTPNYKEQLIFSEKVQELQREIGNAYNQVLKLHTQIQTRISNGSMAMESLKLYDAKLVDFADLPAPADPRNSVGTPLNHVDSLGELNQRVGGILGSVEGVSSKPTADALAAYEQVKISFTVQLEAWKKLVGPELTQLNSALTKVSETSISIK